jgi:hypothetical protein
MPAEKKRKAPALGDARSTPSKRPSILPPSSPSTPLPKSTISTLLEWPGFDRINLLPFNHEISPDLPQNLFDIFALFCPASMVEEWVVYINERRHTAWQPTYTQEIYLFIGILLYMSYCVLPTIPCYWETSTSSALHPITRFMRRDRFLAIYKCFSTWDMTTPMASVFEKIKGWSTHIQEVSTPLYKPSSHVSVDEAMVHFTGKSKDIIHLPNKPISVGYKIWVVADSGYFLHWIYHS